MMMMMWRGFGQKNFFCQNITCLNTVTMTRKIRMMQFLYLVTALLLEVMLAYRAS